MSTQGRAGIRAARALLSLVEDHSAEELEAAESILSGDKDLLNVLRMLRQYKAHEVEPLTVERLRAIVVREILALNLPVKAALQIFNDLVGDEGISIPSHLTAQGLVERLVEHIEVTSASRSEQVENLIALLAVGMRESGPKGKVKFDVLLRELAAQALTENLIMFPTLHSLAQLRTRWATTPLSYQAQESRMRLASRLLLDAELAAPTNVAKIAADLLSAGLSGPADGEIAALRAPKSKKAHGA